MAQSQNKISQPRSKQRIAREAEALRKNLAKRKLQQSQRETQKKVEKNG